jgi:hypothetical protein
MDINNLYGSYECALTGDQASALGEYDLSDADEFM